MEQKKIIIHTFGGCRTEKEIKIFVVHYYFPL